MILQALCQSFKIDLLNAVHNFATHTFKIALYSASANLSTTTTAYTTDGEIVGTGYVAGGVALTVVPPTLIEGIAVTSFQPANWAAATFTVRGALIYNDTAVGDPSVMVLDFGTDRTVTAADFTITFPAVNQSDAILRIV